MNSWLGLFVLAWFAFPHKISESLDSALLAALVFSLIPFHILS